MEIWGRSSPRNVIGTGTSRKDCFPMDGPSLACKTPQSRQKGCSNNTIEGLSFHLGKSITLAFLEYNSDLACAHQLLDLPPIDIGAPELSILPDLNTSADFPDPKGQPFDALASSQYKKAANCVHPIWTTLPEDNCILHHVPSDPLISLPVFPKHPP